MSMSKPVTWSAQRRVSERVLTTVGTADVRRCCPGPTLIDKRRSVTGVMATKTLRTTVIRSPFSCHITRVTDLSSWSRRVRRGVLTSCPKHMVASRGQRSFTERSYLLANADGQSLDRLAVTSMYCGENGGCHQVPQVIMVAHIAILIVPAMNSNPKMCFSFICFALRPLMCPN